MYRQFQREGIMVERSAGSGMQGIRRFAWLWLCLWAITFAVQCGLGGWWRYRLGADYSAEATRVAASIVHNGTFANPYGSMPTGITAHVAPLYPYLYAVLVRIFGEGELFGWMIRVFTLGVWSLQLALLPDLAERCGLSRRSGLAAAAMGCFVLVPGTAYKWEFVLASTLLALAGYAMLGIGSRAGPHAWRQSLLAGSLWALALLASPVLAPICLAWSLVLFAFKTPLRYLATMALVLTLGVSPWLVRNQRVFHRFVFVRDNLGIEARNSNNDCASASLYETIDTGCAATTDPNENRQLAERLIEIGEPQFNAELLQRTIQWVRAHPRQFTELCIERWGLYWFPTSMGLAGSNRLAFLAINSIVCVLTILAIAGLVVLYRRSQIAFWFILSGMLAGAAPFLFFFIELRYRYLSMWMTIFAAGALLTRGKVSGIESRGAPMV